MMRVKEERSSKLCLVFFVVVRLQWIPTDGPCAPLEIEMSCHHTHTLSLSAPPVADESRQ